MRFRTGVFEVVVLAVFTIGVARCSSSSVGPNGDNTNDAGQNDAGQLVCGNGQIEGAEECDDGNNLDGDGCSAECLSEERRWEQIETSQAPTKRSESPLVYDEVRDRVVLFGGCIEFSGAACVGLDDTTWEFDGSNWEARDLPASPPPRMGHNLVYDVARARVVMIGGCTTAPPSDCETDPTSTWEYDGDEWVKRTDVSSPADRSFPAMVYDSTRQRVVLFGGVVHGEPYEVLGDTWEYDGTSWTETTPADSPPPRIRAAMAFDQARQRTVLFGGVSILYLNEDDLFADTWEYDGNAWIQRSPVDAPSARVASATYHAALGRVVLFAGQYLLYVPLLDDTWEYDGITWTQTSPVPSPLGRHVHGMTYDTLRRRVVCHGGINPSYDVEPLVDTWIYASF